MSEWREMSLGQLTENFDGQRIPVKETDRKPGPYPYYGASGIVDHVDQYIFDGEYLLVAEDGENLRTRNTPVAFLARGKFWVNNHAHIFTGNKRADTRFLMYALNNGDISGYLTGSTMPKLTQGSMNRIPILAPPLSEQRAIASVLGALDDKIELNRRMNETLEALAQSLFKSWFVDATQAALPKGWREESVYATADVIYGAPFSSTKFNTEKVGKPLIRIRDLADESPEVSTPEEHPKRYLVKPGDIVVGMDGEFRAHLWGGEESWLNQRVCVFAPKPGFSAPFVLNSIVGLLAEVEATETATTVIHLGKNDIDRFKIVLPPEKLLAEFNRVAEPLFRRIVLNKQESRTLTALRDALLPKLLSGEVRIATAGGKS